MMAVNTTGNPEQPARPAGLLWQWLQHNLPDEALAWLEHAGQQMQAEAEDWQVYASFSLVPRYTGKQLLELTDEQLEQAQALRTGWNPAGLRADEAGRTFLLLSLAERARPEFLEKMENLFRSSDLREAEALYRALPLYPYPEAFRERAAEGIRSNMTSVFEAVALDNPYPAEYLTEAAWNQLILKAVFIGQPLTRIHSLMHRANRTLARMLVEFAQERQAAGRTIPEDLWQLVEPYASTLATDLNLLRDNLPSDIIAQL